MREGTVLLERRPPVGIWGGLLALPEIPGTIADTLADVSAWTAECFGVDCVESSALTPVTHTFTHFVLEIQPVLLNTAAATHGLVAENGALQWLALSVLEGAALPTPVRKILEALATPTPFSD